MMPTKNRITVRLKVYNPGTAKNRGHSPKENSKESIVPSTRTKQQNLHFLADHENIVHLLPSITLMIIARKKSHI